MLEQLINKHKEVIANFKLPYMRKIYTTLESSHRIIGILGTRGVGKTTYILNYIKQNYPDSQKALYISADNIYFSANNLVDLVDEFIKKYDGELLCIDEIHKYPNWSQELKNIYDIYPKFRIIFSGSSNINLVKEKYDLSRRAVLRHLPGFSFREYIEFTQKIEIPILTLDEIAKMGESIIDVTKLPKLMHHFEQYQKVGYYPLFRELQSEKDVYESINGIIDAVIFSDIASYYSIKSTTLPIFKKLLYFFQTSDPSSISINKLANSLDKDHNDVANYLDMLKESGLLRYLLIDKFGHALIRNAEKVYLNNPNLCHAIADSTGVTPVDGSLRELFVLMNLENSGNKVFYSKKGDLSSGEYIFEVGGKNKDTSQIVGESNAFLVKDDILYGGKNIIPLYYFGLLY